MGFRSQIKFWIRKLFHKNDNIFIIKMWINIPTKPKPQKPYIPKKRYVQRSLFDYMD